MNLRYELQRIISGIGKNSARNLIEAAANHLGKSKAASGGFEANEFTKGKEATWLVDWSDQSGKWFRAFDETRFIARGAEQRVYLDVDTRFVLKLNDSIL
ncbi:MAG: hypothetical protein ACOYXA_08720 [Bacteroidota bacterium]